MEIHPEWHYPLTAWLDRGCLNHWTRDAVEFEGTLIRKPFRNLCYLPSTMLKTVLWLEHGMYFLV